MTTVHRDRDGPVYFVKEQWVQDEYYREHPGKRPPKEGKGRGHGHGKKDD